MPQDNVFWKRVSWVLLLLLVSAFGAHAAFAMEVPECHRPNASEAVKENPKLRAALRSVVSVVFQSGGDITIGSGFVFSQKRYIITSAHALEWLSSRGNTGTPSVSVYLSDCSVQAGTILFARTEENKVTTPDLTVLRIQNPPTPLNAGVLGETALHERVYGLAGVFTTALYRKRVQKGQLASKLVFLSPEANIEETMPFVQFSGHMPDNGSGGPLVDDNMRVLGVTTLTSLGPSNSYAIPMNLVVRFLEYQDLL